MEPDRLPLLGEARLGQLSAPAFLAMVLDWLLNSYFTVIEELLAEIDRLDEQLLQHHFQGAQLLDRLVGMRRRVRQLRTTLSPSPWSSWAWLFAPDSAEATPYSTIGGSPNRPLSLWGSALAALVPLLFALTRRGERAVAVVSSVALGMVVVVFAIGGFLTPH